MTSTLLTSEEVLEFFNIKNRKVVGWMVEREILPRKELGPRTFRYELRHCEDIKRRIGEEGLQITIKP